LGRRSKGHVQDELDASVQKAQNSLRSDVEEANSNRVERER